MSEPLEKQFERWGEYLKRRWHLSLDDQQALFDAIRTQLDALEGDHNNLLSNEEAKRRLTERSCDELREQMVAKEAEVMRLRRVLKKAHDAMFSWHSSEYAEHPLSLEVSKELYR